MFKKLSLLMAAVAILAFAVPGMASAQKLTSKAGVLAPVGSTITGTGSDVTLTSSTLGTITCSTLTLTGTVAVNNGTTVTGSSSSVKPPQAGCTNNGNSVTVNSVTVTHLVASPTEQNVTFDTELTINSPSPVTCTFEGVKVPFTFVNGSDTITFTNAVGSGIKGGGCGTAKLDGSFTIEISGTPTILDS